MLPRRGTIIDGTRGRLKRAPRNSREGKKLYNSDAFVGRLIKPVFLGSSFAPGFSFRIDKQSSFPEGLNKETRLPLEAACNYVNCTDNKTALVKKLLFLSDKARRLR